MMNLKMRFFFCTLLLLGLAPRYANADLMVHETLEGALSIGSMGTLDNDTVNGSNLVDYYYADIFGDTASSLRYYSNEYVYEISLTEPARLNLNITSQTPGRTLEFFGLDSLTTEDTVVVIGGMPKNKRLASDTVGRATASSSSMILDSGTHYLSVTAYTGSVFADPAVTSAFVVDYALQELLPPPENYVDLGFIAAPDTPFSLDTLSSSLSDTELALYDSLGRLIEYNDDANSISEFRSVIDLTAGLPEGAYYLAVAEWNAIFFEGFVANDVSAGNFGGNYTLDYTSGTYEGTLAGDEIAWIRFDVGFDPVVLADVDQDGDVDGSDFLLIQAGYGDVYTEANFDAFKETYGYGNEEGGLASSNGVPEPSSVIISLAGIFALAFARRKYRTK